MSTSLYDIGAEMQALEEYLESIDGDISDPKFEEMIDDWIKTNADMLASKLDNYGMLITNRLSEKLAQETEAKRLSERAAANGAFVVKLKERLRDFFLARNIKRVDGTLFKFWTQKNGQRSMTLALEYEGEEGAKKLPKIYQKVVIVPRSDLIRQDLAEIEALEIKQEVWTAYKSAGDAAEQYEADLKKEGVALSEFTKDDAKRLKELQKQVGGIAVLERAGYHIRMK